MIFKEMFVNPSDRLFVVLVRLVYQRRPTRRLRNHLKVQKNNYCRNVVKILLIFSRNLIHNFRENMLVSVWFSGIISCHYLHAAYCSNLCRYYHIVSTVVPSDTHQVIVDLRSFQGISN